MVRLLPAMVCECKPPSPSTATTIRRRRMNARLPFVVVPVLRMPHDISRPGYKNCTRIGVGEQRRRAAKSYVRRGGNYAAQSHHLVSAVTWSG